VLVKRKRKRKNIDRIYRMNMIFQILVIPLILSTYSSFLRRVAAPLRAINLLFPAPLRLRAKISSLKV